MDNKNPDFFIRGLFFEGKSLKNPERQLSYEENKNRIQDRIKKAKKQADNIILEIQDGYNEEQIERTINGFLTQSEKKRIIMVLLKGELKVYKK